MYDIWYGNDEITNINGYSTKTFSGIYPTYTSFFDGVNSVPEFKILKNENNYKVLYYLLLGRYANSPIANDDVNQFSIKLYSIIYQYGPTWEEKKNLQDKIRMLDDDAIKQGSKAIYNHALNPGTDPSTDSLTELEYINDQNTTNYLKSDMEAYNIKWSLLNDRVDENFIRKFQHLFLQIVRPTRNIYYGTKGDDNYE